eukprot:6588008-Pyramimonas_sp.AAC.1
MFSRSPSVGDGRALGFGLAPLGRGESDVAGGPGSGLGSAAARAGSCIRKLRARNLGGWGPAAKSLAQQRRADII